MSSIGFVLKGYPRVSETFIAQEIYLLEQKGFSIEILSMRKAREQERQPIVDLIRAPVTYIPEYVFDEPGEFVVENFKALLWYKLAYIKFLGIAIARSLRSRDSSPLKRFLQAGWLIARKKIGQPGSTLHHLHSHFAHVPTEMTWYIAKITGQTYSISAHAKDIYTIPPEHLTQRINDSQLIMTCTSYNYQFMRNLPGVRGEKVHKIYHGISLESFKPLQIKRYDRDELQRLISVGRLVEKKGYDVIFAALASLKRKGYSFTYDIYGAGELSLQLSRLAAELSISDSIRFHATTTHPQIIRRLDEGGVFICGSKIAESGDRDGIPNTIAEAMAMELPVIATDVSGIPELITSGVDGLLIPEKSASELEAAIERLWSQPDFARQLGQNARAKVARVFDSSVLIRDCATLLAPFKAERV